MTDVLPEQNLAAFAETFRRNVASHELMIARDDGMYRHLQFRVPGTDPYRIEITTWPHHLAITGDLGDGGYVFRGPEDMFGFFRGREPNPGYWTEKLCSGGPVREYCEELFRQHVSLAVAAHADRLPGLAAVVDAEVLNSDWANTGNEDDAELLLDGFVYYEDGGVTRLLRDRTPDFTFAGWQQWDWAGWAHWYLWACHAIPWGIARYDEVGACNF
jgi:hypothetical protein